MHRLPGHFRSNYLPLRDLPVPVTVSERETISFVWAAFAAFTSTVAERVPAAFGTNVIESVQDAPACRLVPVAQPATVKSLAFVPVEVTPLTVSCRVPVFVNVAVFARLVELTATLPKLVDVGDSVALAFGPTASCVTVTVFAAAIMLPVRIEPPLLATL